MNKLKRILRGKVSTFPDEVAHTIGPHSFLTKRGHVVEGNYLPGEKVLLIFDQDSKRFFPMYKKQKNVEIPPSLHEVSSGQQTTSQRGYLIVFYQSEESIKLILVNPNTLEIVGTPKVASGLGFTMVTVAEPFKTFAKTFSYQYEDESGINTRTIYHIAMGIKLTGNYLSEGGKIAGHSGNTIYHYILDPLNGKYFYLTYSLTYDSTWNGGDGGIVLNVIDDKIIVTKSTGAFNVCVYRYRYGAVELLDNPGFSPAGQAFHIDSSGNAYYCKGGTDRDVGICSMDAPFVRMYAGFRLTVDAAVVGYEYTIVLHDHFYSIMSNCYEQPESQTASYTAIEEDTVNIIAQKLALAINNEPETSFSATVSGSNIIIKGLSSIGAVGWTEISGNMTKLDYYPFLFEENLSRNIRKLNVLTDTDELLYEEEESYNETGEWDWFEPCNIYEGEWLIGHWLIARLYIWWHSHRGDPIWDVSDSDDKHGVWKLKKDQIVSTAQGFSCFFTDEDREIIYSGDATINNYPDYIQDMHERIDYSQDSAYYNNTIFLDKISHWDYSDTEIGEDINETYWYRRQTWTFKGDIHEFFFVNFPFCIEKTKPFYVLNKKNYNVDILAEREYNSKTYRFPTYYPPWTDILIYREFGDGVEGAVFDEITGRLVTPYEEIELTKTKTFDYGWTHIEDRYQDLLLQGIQLNLRADEEDINEPILYRNGVRKEVVLATLLGVSKENIFGIVYAPFLRADPDGAKFA